MINNFGHLKKPVKWAFLRTIFRMKEQFQQDYNTRYSSCEMNSIYIWYAKCEKWRKNNECMGNWRYSWESCKTEY